MRSKKLATLIVAASLGGGLATAMAAPANADQIDKVFLQVLDEKGVRVKPSVDPIALAHSTCNLLAGGATPTDALKKIQSVTGLSVQDTTTFGGLAIYGYCKQYLPK